MGIIISRRIGIGAIILLMMAIGIWVVLPKHQGPFVMVPGARAGKIPARELPVRSPPTVIAQAVAANLWTRRSADVASRMGRRHGFAWILRQLGASEDQLDRLADGDIAGVLADLKQKARAGDAASINILGDIALQNCELGRNDATIASVVDSQIRDAPAAAGIDIAWFSAVMRADQAFDRKLNAACAEVDRDEALSWVKAQADKGDAVSLWLMFRNADNLGEMQQYLRESAAAGFPQAQYEAAGAIIAGQKGAAGTGPDKENAGALLREAQQPLATAEQQLALCEFSGCDGVAVDVDSAIKHAREAAQRGAIDGMLAIGPRLPAGQISPDEVAAWGLVQASLQQEGCGGSGFTLREMKIISGALQAKNISAESRVLAEQYWQTYGAQITSNLGCTS